MKEKKMLQPTCIKFLHRHNNDTFLSKYFLYGFVCPIARAEEDGRGNDLFLWVNLLLHKKGQGATVNHETAVARGVVLDRGYNLGI